MRARVGAFEEPHRLGDDGLGGEVVEVGRTEDADDRAARRNQGRVGFPRKQDDERRSRGRREVADPGVVADRQRRGT